MKIRCSLRSEARRSMTAWAVGLATAGLVLAGCGGDEGGSGSGTSSGEEKQVNVAGKTSIEMEMDDDYFEPSALVGKPGQELTIELTNKGSKEHNFSISGTDVDVDVAPGKAATVRVSFPASGTVEFVCEYHEAAGMTGELQTSG